MEARGTLATLIQSCWDPDPNIRPPASEICQLLEAVRLVMVMSCEMFTRSHQEITPPPISGWTRFVTRRGRFSGLSEFCSQIFLVVSMALRGMSHSPYFWLQSVYLSFPSLRDLTPVTFAVSVLSHRMNGVYCQPDTWYCLKKSHITIYICMSRSGSLPSLCNPQVLAPYLTYGPSKCDTRGVGHRIGRMSPHPWVLAIRYRLESDDQGNPQLSSCSCGACL